MKPKTALCALLYKCVRCHFLSEGEEIATERDARARFYNLSKNGNLSNRVCNCRRGGQGIAHLIGWTQSRRHISLLEKDPS